MKLEFPHSIKDTVKKFSGKAAWYYITVPKKYTKMSKQYKRGRFVRILAQIGSDIWQTSLLPYGNGTEFIAIKAQIRKSQNIKEGDTIKLHFRFVGE